MRFPINWQNLRLANKLALLFIASSLITLIAFAFTNDLKTRAEIIAEARERNLQRARATTQLLDFYLASIEANVQLVAVSPGTVEFLSDASNTTHREDMENVLRIAQEHSEYDAVFILNSAGNILLSTDEKLLGRNYTTARWFRSAVTGQSSFDEPRYDMTDGKVYIYVSAPVLTTLRQVVGVAVVRLTLEPIDRILTADVNYDGRNAFGILSDENGIRLSYPTQQDLRFSPSAELPTDLLNQMVFESRFGPKTATILGTPTKWDEFVRRGKSLLFDSQADPYLNVNSVSTGNMELAMAPLKNKRWLYSVGTPQSQLLAEANAQVQSVLLQAIGVGVIALGVSVLGAQWVTRPLRQVTEGARALTAGDLSRRIGLNQKDEVGELAATFDTMAATLEQKDLALQQHSQKIEAVNAELDRTNIELKHASRMKDEFLSSMSHELRTPLTGILGLSEALQMKTYGELSEKQFKALHNIEMSGRHLLDLINDILDLSKIEAGKFEIKLEECAVYQICQASLQLTRGMANKKRQQINFVMNPATITIQADNRRLKQMLVNLLSNAIKFTPEGGQLGLEVEGDEVAHLVKLIVWDKGIGIKAENIELLFKPFVQLDSSLSRQYSGTGLGLSLVQHMAKLHGGSVQVESTLGEGSRFTILLPWTVSDIALDFTSSPDIVLPRPSSTSNNLSHLILIADDNQVVLDVLSDFLQSQNYLVVTTNSGEELLSRVAELQPDIMLVDIQMPGMDGLETIRRLRTHTNAKVATTPVLAVTALAMIGDREICLAAGANDYLSKPVNLPLLLETIDDLLKKEERPTTK